MIDRRRQILASGGFTLMMEFDLDLPEDALVRADSGEMVMLHSPTGDRVRALVAIDPGGRASISMPAGSSTTAC